MQSKFLLLPVVLALGACATDAPVIKTVIQKVEIPIAVQCKATVPTAPDLNFPKLQSNQDIFDKTKALLADRDLQLGYEGELSAALTSCIK